MFNTALFKSLFNIILDKLNISFLPLPKTSSMLLNNSVDKVVIRVKINTNVKENFVFEKKRNKKMFQKQEFDLKVFKVINYNNRAIIVVEKNKILAIKQAVESGYGDSVSSMSAKEITKSYLAKRNSCLPTYRGVVQ